MTELDVKRVLQKAIDTYGREEQLIVLIEEMSELTKAICKYKRANEYYLPEDIRDNIVEEVADVTIMLAEMHMMFNFEDDVNEQIEYKIKRLAERLGMQYETNRYTE